MSTRWEQNRRRFGPLAVMLIVVGSYALLLWHSDWNVFWIVQAFGVGFGLQWVLILLGVPPVVPWLMMIVAVIEVVLATVASRGHHNTHILWYATGFFVGAWAGREQGGRATG